MILSDRRKKERLPRIYLAGVLLLGLAFLVPPVLRDARPDPGRPVSNGVITCGAEFRKGDFFTEGDLRFDNGNTQSDERARFGRYSCRLLPGDQLQFGIGAHLKDLRAGGLYQATVWRFQHPGSRSYLAAQSSGGRDPFYLSQALSFHRDEKGWEQVKLQFFIPFRHLPESVQVFVFSEGKDTVYFDDFQVRLLRTFQESDLQLPVIDLKLDKGAMEKLEAKRAEALRAGLLETGPDDWVKGKLGWKGAEAPVPVRVRLKGDWLDHLNERKWSFRVALTGERFWNGMQTFSLQHPGTRYYLHEWLLHECWMREGVLTTSYDFAELRLNGESLGLYAVEEHFEKYLVERQGRREGPILKLDESGFWDGLQQQIAVAGEVSPEMRLATANAAHAAIEPFDLDRVVENPDLHAMSRRAGALVEQFRNGARPASALFNLDRLARFYAIADLMGADHCTAWHNLRFYYDPVSDRLEPVGFDGFGTGPSQRSSFLLQGHSGPEEGRPLELQDLLFLDTAFVARYVGYLYRYSSPGYLDNFFDSITTRRLPREIALLREYTQYVFEDRDFIRSVQYKRAMLIPQAGYCFSASRIGTGPMWELRNLHPFPVRLLGYSFSREGAWTGFVPPIWFPGAPDRPLWSEAGRDSSGAWADLGQLRNKAGGLSAARPWPGPVTAEIPEGAGWLVFRLPGVDTLYRQELRPGLALLPQTPRQELFDGPLPLPDPCWEIKGKRIRFLPGRHAVAKMLVVPEGYSVVAGPGTKLDFVSGGGFLSASPVHLKGSADAPVHIMSSDGSGNGFTVLAPGTASSLEYAVFEGLGSLQWRGWSQTGAVTFAVGSLRVSDCIFRYTRSEDALNLVQCRVEMDRCLFLDTPSDGFDCDFCQGEIRNSSFRQCRNDGLDISGSRLRLASSGFENCGEKGISVGEGSDLACFDSRISNSPTGIAVKDLSIAICDNISLDACDTGFSVYRKKPEFGPARLVVKSHSAVNLGRLYFIEKGSTLQLGERLIRGTAD